MQSDDDEIDAALDGADASEHAPTAGDGGNLELWDAPRTDKAANAGAPKEAPPQKAPHK